MMKLEGKLTRKNAHYLETGLACGLRVSVGGTGSLCGGDLLVRDWAPVGERGAARYELYCDRCLCCDPNGWARQEEILPAARRTFRGWVKEAAEAEVEILRA